MSAKFTLPLLVLLAAATACAPPPQPTLGLGGPECPRRASVERDDASSDRTRERLSLIATRCGEDVDTLYFGPGDAVLGPRGRAKIDALVACLEEPSLSSHAIVVSGHADWRGEQSANMELALRRANTVKDELTTRGIDPQRVRTKSRGEQQAGCGAPELGDRRATIRLVPRS